MNDQLKEKVELSCIKADEFAKLYYHCFDNLRYQITRLYHNNGVCVWNGNAVSGINDLQKLFSELPSSEHTLTTLDSQPIVDDAVAGQLTHIFQVGGSVKFANQTVKLFQQSFVITATEGKWKIISNVFRFQDALAMTEQ